MSVSASDFPPLVDPAVNVSVDVFEYDTCKPILEERFEHRLCM
jgi:hypothetical protein